MNNKIISDKELMTKARVFFSDKKLVKIKEKEIHKEFISAEEIVYFRYKTAQLVAR
jgi:hypothetical protein